MEGNSACTCELSDPVLPFERLGHYRVLRRIGHGGMGVVYLGYEDALQRQVALKVLPAELTRSEDFVRRFRAEAMAVARLAHPHIVPIHFTGQDAGHHFFAMQYVEGESIARLLARRGRLGVAETLALLEQCLSGLGAAHEAGLVHRDVKPGNILLEGKSLRALVADFGLVKSMVGGGGMTASGVIVGTVNYIPPEQASGQEVDGRSDLYSLGVMTYQMLCGRLPFHAKTNAAMIFQHTYGEPRPLREVAPDVPQPLADLVDKLMAKEPAERYQRCEDVLADVRRFRAGEPLVLAVRARAVAQRSLSQIFNASDFGRLLTVPGAAPAVPANPRRRISDRVRNLFQIRVPELVQKLRNSARLRWMVLASALALVTWLSGLLLPVSPFTVRSEVEQPRMTEATDFIPPLQTDSRLRAKLTADQVKTANQQAYAWLPQDHFERALPVCNQLIEDWPMDPHAYYTRAFVFLRQQKWPQAGEDLERFLTLYPEHLWGRWLAAMLCVYQGDVAAYRKHVATAYPHLARDLLAIDKNSVTTTCLIGPSDVPDLDKLVRAAKEFQHIEGSHRALALALYRQGKYQQALQVLTANEKNRPRHLYTGEDEFLRVMVLHRLKRPQEAEKLFAAEVSFMDEDFPKAGGRALGHFEWASWLLVHIYRREAEALLTGKPLFPEPK